MTEPHAANIPSAGTAGTPGLPSAYNLCSAPIPGFGVMIDMVVIFVEGGPAAPHPAREYIKRTLRVAQPFISLVAWRITRGRNLSLRASQCVPDSVIYIIF